MCFQDADPEILHLNAEPNETVGDQQVGEVC